MTVLQAEKKNNRGWADQEAKNFIKEVERLKESWISTIKEPLTSEALANLRDFSDAILRLERERENVGRREENESRRKERLRKIKVENKNLEWPKPDRPFLVRKSEDYWKPDGCVWCGYRPKTIHDYEVHIVTRHPGKPAYPGSADLEKYRQLQNDRRSRVADMAEADLSGNGSLGND